MYKQSLKQNYWARMSNNINTISDRDEKRASVAWHIVLIIEVAPKIGLHSFRTKMKDECSLWNNRISGKIPISDNKKILYIKA